MSPKPHDLNAGAEFVSPETVISAMCADRTLLECVLYQALDLLDVNPEDEAARIKAAKHLNGLLETYQRNLVGVSDPHVYAALDFNEDQESWQITFESVNSPGTIMPFVLDAWLDSGLAVGDFDAWSFWCLKVNAWGEA